ncbi:hypothetical protein BH11PSE12_BH11PSE12_34430 [soil metagenome]
MSKFVQRAVAIAALSTLAIAAQAAELSNGLHFVLNAGITGGGDTLATVNYVGGSSQNIKAGNLFQLGGGVLWHASTMPLETQITLNYHIDDTSATNGSVKFERVPLEVAAFYTGVQKWRFGGGVRYVTAPKYTSQINGGANETVDFKNSIGALVEAGYGFTPHAWLNVRYVAEKYQPKTYTRNGVATDVSGTRSFSGNHVGINFLYAF